MSQLASKTIFNRVIVENHEPVETLSLIRNLLEALHESRISYCHWKSNEHLDASMTGDTDLDVLFDNNQKVILLTILEQLGFKNFHSIKQKQYRDIEDFIGLDLPSGKVVHLHAHFRLTLGEPYLKSYQLSLEGKVLETRVFDRVLGIYCIHPAFEMILLYFREALKIRNRDRVKMLLKKKIHYRGNILREYRWLKERCDDQEIMAILKSIFPDYQPVYQIVTGEFNRLHLSRLSVLIKKEFGDQRLYSPLQALLLRWYREVSVKVYRKSGLLWKGPIVSRRVNPHGGLVVAVVGADGSGKSTVIANLQNTFSTKLDVYKVYLGRGDGRISFARSLLLGLKDRLAPRKKQGWERVEGSGSGRKQGWLANLYKCLEALAVAREKAGNISRIRAARKKGMLVICDRFPQNQVMGYNDGPLLHYLAGSANPFFRAAARREARIYAMAQNNPPDILFKLIAEAAVVEARKPNETPLHKLEKKIEGIKRLQYPRSCQVVEIDAAQPLEKVLFLVKKGIWDACP